MICPILFTHWIRGWKNNSNLYDSKGIHICIQTFFTGTYQISYWKNFLLRCDQKRSVYQPYNLEIETSTVCNWACEYYLAQNRLPIQKFISLPLFNYIIKEAIAYGKFCTIALHSYNEPTLNPNFIYYVEAIAQTDIKLVLYTKGSGLTDEILNFLLKAVFQTTKWMTCLYLPWS